MPHTEAFYTRSSEHLWIAENRAQGPYEAGGLVNKLGAHECSLQSQPCRGCAGGSGRQRHCCTGHTKLTAAKYIYIQSFKTAQPWKGSGCEAVDRPCRGYLEYPPERFTQTVHQVLREFRCAGTGGRQPGPGTAGSDRQQPRPCPPARPASPGHPGEGCLPSAPGSAAGQPPVLLTRHHVNSLTANCCCCSCCCCCHCCCCCCN